MLWGNKPTDGGKLLLTAEEKSDLERSAPMSSKFIRRIIGSQEMLQGDIRYCIWIEDDDREEAEAIPQILSRTKAVAEFRASSKAAQTRPAAAYPHRFRQIQDNATRHSFIIPSISSESREGFPIGFGSERDILSNRAFGIYDASFFNFSILSSRLHLVWLDTVCGKLETRYSYSNTLGWHSFPVPKLTESDKANLTRCAEDILLAREAHFPATIAELYDPEKMPDDLRAAHDRNDETLERIYIGRRFRNDTERLEKLFDMYTKMTAKKEKAS